MRTCSKILIIVLVIVSISISSAKAQAGALSSSISGREATAATAPTIKANSRDKALTNEIEGKRLQSMIFEKTFEMDFESLRRDLADPKQSPSRMEASYRKLLVLMNISVANPYEERMLYNQLFQLETDLNEQIQHYKEHSQTISNDLLLLNNAKKELSLLATNDSSPSLNNSSRKFIHNLNKLSSILKKSAPIAKRLHSLDKLQQEMKVSIDKVSEGVPELLMAYLVHLRISILSPAVQDRIKLAPSFWLMGQPAQSLAKIPEETEEIAFALISPLFLLLIFYVLGRKKLGNAVLSIASVNSTARRVLLQVWVLAPVAGGLIIGAQFIDFPSSLLPLQAGLIIGFWAAMKLAWSLRIIKMGVMPSTPLYPLYWSFVLGITTQFLNIPLIMMSVIWPLVMLGVYAALLHMNKRSYPNMEKYLLKTSLWICIVLAMICIEGHVYFAILFSLWWFLFTVCLQLGTAVSRLLKEKSKELFLSEKDMKKGMLLSLGVPTVWFFLFSALLIWTMTQFGEIRLLYKLAGNTNIVAAAATLLSTVMAIRLLTAFEQAHSTATGTGQRPLKGFLQISRLLIFTLGLGTALCLALDRSPWALIGGIGAIAAALLLVFKETILALVAGVRIVLDDLLRIGDWIEINDLGVNGDVIDVSLHCIKIRNFDRTIVTIPTITLTTTAFKNWRGMTESGGRRIKRSIPIDLSSIFFLDAKWTARLKKIDLLKDWFTEKETDWEFLSPDIPPVKGLIAQDALTNLTAFRAYMEAWLLSGSHLHRGLTFMVRPLDPNAERGFP